MEGNTKYAIVSPLATDQHAQCFVRTVCLFFFSFLFLPWHRPASLPPLALRFFLSFLLVPFITQPMLIHLPQFRSSAESFLVEILEYAVQPAQNDVLSIAVPCIQTHTVHMALQVSAATVRHKGGAREQEPPLVALGAPPPLPQLWPHLNLLQDPRCPLIAHVPDTHI